MLCFQYSEKASSEKKIAFFHQDETFHLGSDGINRIELDWRRGLSLH